MKKITLKERVTVMLDYFNEQEEAILNSILGDQNIMALEGMLRDFKQQHKRTNVDVLEMWLRTMRGKYLDKYPTQRRYYTLKGLGLI
jgi:hypothetical protein